MLVCPAAGAQKHHAARAAAPAPTVPVTGIYSARALRRTRLLIQLQLLELRKARLERVRKAIRERLPVEDLLRQI